MIKSTLNTELHKVTGGNSRRCTSPDQEVSITVSEDIGRHNALDKVIGYAIRNGYRSLPYFHHRVGEDLVRNGKECLVANIPSSYNAGVCNHYSLTRSRRKERPYRGSFCPGIEDEYLYTNRNGLRWSKQGPVQSWSMCWMPARLADLPGTKTPRIHGHGVRPLSQRSG